MTRAIAVVAIALVVVGGGAFAFITAGQTAQEGSSQDGASIELTTQTSDNRTVIVDSVTLPEGGFVTIHDASDLEAGLATDSVIGTSMYLEAGTHEDVPVTLSEPVDEDNVRVTAMAHKDTNGNQAYDFVVSDGEVDGPYMESADVSTATPSGTETATETVTATETATDTATATETETATDTATETETATDTETETETGTSTAMETATSTPGMTETETAEEVPVTATATIMFNEEEGPDTNLEFSDQSSNGTTVTVDRVTLYRGGYVVIHAPSLGDNGSARTVLGSTGYMEPGTYEDVEITLSKEIEDSMTLEEGQITLNAVPHHEENGNLVNDYVISDGETDGAYMANGSMVNASATVTLEEDAGGTATPSTETSTATATETSTATATETTTG